VGPGPLMVAGHVEQVDTDGVDTVASQQHQREKPGDLAVLRQAGAQLPGQADGLGGQLDPL